MTPSRHRFQTKCLSKAQANLSAMEKFCLSAEAERAVAAMMSYAIRLRLLHDLDCGVLTLTRAMMDFWPVRSTYGASLEPHFRVSMTRKLVLYLVAPHEGENSAGSAHRLGTFRVEPRSGLGGGSGRCQVPDNDRSYNHQLRQRRELSALPYEMATVKRTK